MPREHEDYRPILAELMERYNTRTGKMPFSGKIEDGR